jgi:putative pyruvate formate lyase activating enzyme
MKLESCQQIPERLKALQSIMRDCRLCPRNCGVDRTAGQTGYCGVDDKLYCFREMLYNGEEQELCPSHQVYFAGCNIRCEYCSVAEWNQRPMQVKVCDIGQLSEDIWRRIGQGAVTLNLLGGEPAVNVAGILELLWKSKPTNRIVWNSNMYYNSPVTEAIRGLADIVLADLKFGCDQCAMDIAEVVDYCGVVVSNIEASAEWSDVIVRHRVLPGHFECCTVPGLKRVAQMGNKVRVSLWFDYIPPIPAVKTPAGYVDDKQRKQTIDYAESLKLRITQ